MKKRLLFIILILALSISGIAFAENSAPETSSANAEETTVPEAPAPRDTAFGNREESPTSAPENPSGGNGSGTSEAAPAPDSSTQNEPSGGKSSESTKEPDSPMQDEPSDGSKSEGTQESDSSAQDAPSGENSSGNTKEPDSPAQDELSGGNNSENTQEPDSSTLDEPSGGNSSENTQEPDSLAQDEQSGGSNSEDAKKPDSPAQDEQSGRNSSGNEEASPVPGESGTEPEQPDQEAPKDDAPETNEPGGNVPDEPGNIAPDEPGEDNPAGAGQDNPDDPGKEDPDEPNDQNPGDPEEDIPGESAPSEGDPDGSSDDNTNDPGDKNPDEPGDDDPDEPGEDNPDNPSEDDPDNPSEDTPDEPSEDDPDEPVIPFTSGWLLVPAGQKVYSDAALRRESGSFTADCVAYVPAYIPAENEDGRDVLQIAFAVSGKVVTGYIAAAGFEPYDDEAESAYLESAVPDAFYLDNPDFPLVNAAYAPAFSGGGRPTPNRGSWSGGRGGTVQPGYAADNTHAIGDRDRLPYWGTKLNMSASPENALTLDGAEIGISLTAPDAVFTASLADETTLVLATDVEQEWRVNGSALQTLAASGIDLLCLQSGDCSLSLPTEACLSGAEYDALRAQGISERRMTLFLSLTDDRLRASCEADGVDYPLELTENAAFRLNATLTEIPIS